MGKSRSGQEEKHEKKQGLRLRSSCWSKHAAGSSVTFAMNLEAHGHEMTGTHTETLKDAGPKSRTITTRHAMMRHGMEHAQEADEVEDLPARAGEESLKIDGREYTCTVWSSAAVRIWLSNPAATPLKIEIREGGETYVLLAVRVGEKVSAGGKVYDCTRLEGGLPTERGKAQAKTWMNPDVPGMTVKAELDLGGDRKMALELREFKIAK